MQPVSLKSVLKRALKNLDLYDVYRRQRALVLWERVCGKEVANVSKALKLKGAILFVGVVDHIWASELTNFVYQYIRKYNRLVGHGVVAEIRFKADPRLFTTKKRLKSEFNLDEINLSRNDQKKIEEMTAELADETARNLMAKMLAGKFRYDRWLKNHGGEQCLRCNILLPKGESFCPHCTREMESINAGKLREFLEQTPWVSFAEAQKTVMPITVELYDDIKTGMAERMYRQIIDSIEATRGRIDNRETVTAEIKGWIIDYSMLVTCNRPAQLGDAVLQKVLSPVMYEFYRTGGVSK